MKHLQIALLAIIMLAAAPGCKTLDWVKDNLPDWPEKEQPTEPTDPGQPDPDPTPQPPQGDHVVRRIGVWWGGYRGMETARVDERFQLTVSDDGRTWSAAPSDWPAGRAGPGCPSDCNVMVCAAYQRPDGVWVGGKYEWNRARPSTRSWSNIKNGYNGWVAPPSGTRMIVWCYTADGHRVSTTAEATFR